MADRESNDFQMSQVVQHENEIVSTNHWMIEIQVLKLESIEDDELYEIVLEFFIVWRSEAHVEIIEF